MNNLIRLLAALLCTCMCIITTHAQISVESQSSQVDMRTQIDFALSSLSMSPVTSGILLQRTIPLFDPDLRGIHSEADSVYMTYDQHDLIYRNLYDARISGSTLENPERAYASDHDGYTSSDTVPILLSALRYHMMDTLAVADGRLLISGGQLYYGSGDPAAVYDIDDIYTSGLFTTQLPRTVTLSLPSNMLIGNLAIDPSTVTIDAGEGLGYRPMPVGGYLSVTYVADDTYVIKIKYRSTGGQYVVHYHNVTVSEAYGDTGSRGEEIDFNCPANCVCEDIYDPLTGTGINVSYRLSCRDADGITRSRDLKQLKRPLIMLDGINLFWAGNAAAMDSVLFDSRRGMLYRNTQVLENQSLGDILDNNDYDIVFVDYHDHHASIADNAAAFQQLLRRINKIKADNGSPYENIVLGVSMGGVVSTYGIRDMELKGEDHDISDFITFDSPIQGANISVGMQGLVLNVNNFLRGFWLLNGLEFLGVGLGPIDVIKGVEKVFSSSSPRQMLMYNIYDHEGDTHFKFYSKLTEMGPVANARTLAISNGSSTATMDIPPSSKILSIADLQPYSGVGYENFLLSVLHGLSRWTGLLRLDVTMDAYTAPGKVINNNITVLYDGSIEIFALYGLVKSHDHTQVIGNTTMRAIDSAPGGTIGTGAVGLAIDGSAFSGYGIDLYIQDLCFIPTVSALNLQGVSADLMHPNMLTTDFSSTTYDAVMTQVGPAPVLDAENNPRTDSNGNPITTNNNGHVTMNFDNITALLGVAQIEGERLGNILEGRTYNFGESASTDIAQVGSYRPTSTGHGIIRDLTVKNGGNLWINRDDRIGFTNTLTNRLNSNPKTYDVSFKRDICGNTPTTLLIDAGGTMTLGQSTVTNEGIFTLGEDNKMIIQNGGVVTLETRSKIIVQKHALLTIKSGGVLVIDNLASLEILVGGRFIMELGSRLEIKGNGSVIINKGANMRVHKGARIITDQPMPDPLYYHTNPIKGSHISLSGDLQLADGEINIEGKGHLIFNVGHKIIGNGNITFKGHGTKHPAYYIDDHVKIDYENVMIDNAYFYLNNELTIKGNGSHTFSTNASKFDFYSDLWEVTDGKATPLSKHNLNINNIKSAIFNSTQFKDVICKINKCGSVNGSSVHAVTHTKPRLFELTDVAKATFNRSTFRSEKPIYGLWTTINTEVFKMGIDLLNVGELRLNYSEIIGFNKENGLRIPTNKAHIGISAEKSPYIFMKDSKILKCQYGIKANDAYNLTMINSEIGNCDEIGIEMIGDRESGLVKMICSSIHNCPVGILGGEITLAIDGLINAQTGYGSANTFINNKIHFSVKYEKKARPDIIYARYNNWTNPPSDVNGVAVDYSFAGLGLCDQKKPVDCAALPPKFPIIITGSSTEVYRGFCPDATTCTGFPIMEKYWRGFNCYFNDNLESGVEELLPLGLDHYSTGNDDLGKYCRAMLAEA